jgi:hypothetical protein
LRAEDVWASRHARRPENRTPDCRPMPASRALERANGNGALLGVGLRGDALLLRGPRLVTDTLAPRSVFACSRRATEPAVSRRQAPSPVASSRCGSAQPRFGARGSPWLGASA